MSGLILVSHNQCQRSTLTAIYDGILSRQGGVWISWDGESRVMSPDASRPYAVQQMGQYETVTFPYTPGELNEGYHNYIHKGLWPVFHQRPDMARFSPAAIRNIKTSIKPMRAPSAKTPHPTMLSGFRITIC